MGLTDASPRLGHAHAASSWAPGGRVRMLIRDIMTTHPVYINADATVHRAAEIISNAEVSDVMVVGDGKHLVGVLSEGDLIRAVLPNYDERFCWVVRWWARFAQV